MPKIPILIIFAIIFAAGCKQNIEQKSPPPGVVVAPATKGNVISSTEIIGQARAYDEVDLVARVEGFLVKRCFEEGQLVKKNDPLFEIEKEEYQAKVQAAEAALLRSQAIYTDKEADYQRQKKLLEENVIAQKNYDSALSAYMQAKADVMGSEAALSNDKLNLSYTSIAAPFDGKIGLSTYSEGNLVSPDSKRLANIVKLDPMRIQFNVNELDVINVNLGRADNDTSIKDRLIVRIQFQNGVTYGKEGELSFVDNKINTATGTLLIEALFPNPDRTIIPGMYVKVILEGKTQISALLIPLSSVQESQAGKSVLVLDKENKVKQRLIKTGIKSGPCIQVTEGLTEGEMVIVEGIQKVRLDMVVKPVVDEKYGFQ